MLKDNNLRILIVDDNPEIHKDFIKILTTKSKVNPELNQLAEKIFSEDQPSNSDFPRFQIDVASQGQEGANLIAKAIEAGNPYALAFVDIRMPPGWDGIETIEHIWELDQDIQIVICTAYSDYSWEETVQRLGQRENLLILKKPFDNVAVRQLACALTKKWQLMQKSREYTQSLEERVKERTHLLEQSLTVTRGTLESSADGILVINKLNQVIDYNNKLVEVWQIPKTMLETKNASVILQHIVEQMETPDQFLTIINELNHQTDIIKIDKLKTKDNRYFEHYSQPYKLKSANEGRIWSFRDITKRAQLEEKIQHNAMHDELTGLPNRAMLLEHINKAIHSAKRDNNYVAILFFDLDRFKLINDSLSHSMGDELLREIANRLTGNIREIDTFARLGGDEFVLVAPALKMKREAGRIAKKILELFVEPFIISNHQVRVSPSIGISIFPLEGNDAEELLRHADIAMYRAKALKGNQFQYYTKELGKQSLKRLEKEMELHKAILQNEFFLIYQPVYGLVSKKLISVEALIRWRHPNQGILLPLEFIPIAEETGLIIAIGSWVLREACQQNKKWQQRGFTKIRVAVNIGSHQIKDANLVNIIKSALQESGLEPYYLELEITENVIVNNIESLQMIEELSQMGVRITLDDFGTGYSCLSYLRNMPVNTIKIDRSFIKNINEKKGDEIILQAIISMAHDLNVNIVAEGIETNKQLEFLKARQCEEGQGFYFTQPLAAEGIEDILKMPNTIIKE